MVKPGGDPAEAAGAPGSDFARHLHAFADELDYVYRTLRRYGVRAMDAEDVAQEVFLITWRRQGDFDTSRPSSPLAGRHRLQAGSPVPPAPRAHAGRGQRRAARRFPFHRSPRAGARGAGCPGAGSACAGPAARALPRGAGGARAGRHAGGGDLRALAGPPFHAVHPAAAGAPGVRRGGSPDPVSRRPPPCPGAFAGPWPAADDGAGDPCRPARRAPPPAGTPARRGAAGQPERAGQCPGIAAGPRTELAAGCGRGRLLVGVRSRSSSRAANSPPASSISVLRRRQQRPPHVRFPRRDWRRSLARPRPSRRPPWRPDSGAIWSASGGSRTAGAARAPPIRRPPPGLASCASWTPPRRGSPARWAAASIWA